MVGCAYRRGTERMWIPLIVKQLSGFPGASSLESIFFYTMQTKAGRSLFCVESGVVVMFGIHRGNACYFLLPEPIDRCAHSN